MGSRHSPGRGPGATAAISALAALLAVVVLHEAFTATMGLGIALVLAALGMLARA